MDERVWMEIPLRTSILMDQFNIQINKTSRNTVLFMTNIGTTEEVCTYLTNALLKIADELDEEFKALNKARKRKYAKTNSFLNQRCSAFT